jgi:hypothetical protein
MISGEVCRLLADDHNQTLYFFLRQTDANPQSRVSKLEIREDDVEDGFCEDMLVEWPKCFEFGMQTLLRVEQGQILTIQNS